jgi:hypothetical protein
MRAQYFRVNGQCLDLGFVTASEAATMIDIIARGTSLTFWFEPITLSIVNQDGGEVGNEEYDDLEELLKEWPEAQNCGGYYEVWSGSRA